MAMQMPQWFDSIPAFKAVGDQQGILGGLFRLLQRGVQAFATQDEGKTVLFLGEGGKLYELHKQADDAEEGKPKEINIGKHPWKLEEGAEDLSGVSVSSTDNHTFVLDTEMKFFHLSEAGLTRCLADHKVGQVACGHQHVAVVTTDGLVFASGYNARGQLGLGHQNNVAIPDMQPMQLPKSQFYTSVACGYVLTVVLCENRTAYGCGRLGDNDYPSPVELKSPVGPFVKVACGSHHALFLTATGRLAGCGMHGRKQLTSLGHSQQPQEIPFNAEKGRLVDIFCHPSLHASVVLTSADEFYVCGQGGFLFGFKQEIPQFHPCDRSAVILFGHVVCTKPPSGAVWIPEFDNPDYCDIELTVKASATSDGNANEVAGTSAVELADELLPRLPKATVVKLAQHALHEGSLSAADVLHQRKLQMPEEQGTCAAGSAQAATSVHVASLAVHIRSPYLWNLLESDMQNGVVREAEEGKTMRRRTTVSLRKYSLAALRAYGQFLHEDRVVADATVAVELLELAREYCDENGLAAQCAWVAKHQVTAKDLHICLQVCMEQGQTALGVELVRRQLCLENCCDVLRVAEMGRADCPHAEYLRRMAMAFAAVHASDVLKSERFSTLDDGIKVRLLETLGKMDKL